MRQAIVTKYLGPTDYRGGRVSVRTQRGRRVYGWNHALSPERNHEAAAEQYARDAGWHGRLQGGGLPDGGYCFVFVDDT